jgi:hypothetical protein
METVLHSENIITPLVQEEVPPQAKIGSDARGFDNALEVVGHRFAEDVVQDSVSEEGIGQNVPSSNKESDLVGEASGEFPVDPRSFVHLFLGQISPVSSAQMTQEEKTPIVSSRNER